MLLAGNTVSENVPKRAFMELYTRNFQAAVDAGVGSVMCSYNRINNTYACENPETIAWLKAEGGFDGCVLACFLSF
jgi:beta-glucosidase